MEDELMRGGEIGAKLRRQSASLTLDTRSHVIPYAYILREASANPTAQQIDFRSRRPPAHHTDEGGAPGEPDSHRVCLPSLGGASLSARASTRVRRLRRTLSAGENAVRGFRSFRWLNPCVVVASNATGNRGVNHAGVPLSRPARRSVADGDQRSLVDT